MCSILDLPTHGDASVNPDCSSGTYVPDPNVHGDDRFSYTVGDGVAKEGVPAKVTVSILPLNDIPVAVTDAATTQQDMAVAIPVLANDIDADGHPLTLVSVDNPASGVITAIQDGTVTYTPSPGFAGVDGFGYTVSDPEGGTTTGRVVVTVIPSPVSVAGIAREPSDGPGGDDAPFGRSSSGGLRPDPTAVEALEAP
jgi:Big-like domain-containing protein